MPIEYVPYAPQPVEGQAVLNNVVRTRRLLTYRGADGAERRIARGLPLYDVETTERVGDAQPFSADTGNLLVAGSCLATCAYLKDQGVLVDLVYIDPPFASGVDYTKTIYLRRNPKKAEALAQAEAELEGEDVAAFEEAMYGDIWTKEAYLDWMRENLVAIKAVMAPQATVYVHLDSHIVHYIKVLMDEIFGDDRFLADVVWKRTSAHSSAVRFAPVHDTILVYSAGEDYVWNPVYQPYDEEYVEAFFTQEDEGGRWQRADLTGAGVRTGESAEPWSGYNPTDKNRHWAVPKWAVAEALEALDRETDEATDMTSIQKLDALNEAGMVHLPEKEGSSPRLKKYLDKMPGTPAQDVITDIKPPHNLAQERTGYPTQKPVELLERFIAASSDEGMLVADFFGGSGTTARAAHALGRRFVTADVGANSLQTSRDTLRDAGAAFEVAHVRDGVALFRNPAQTMDRLAGLVPGLATGGVPAPWFGHVTDPTLGPVPVYLPNLVDTNSRVLDVPALNRLLTALPDLDDATQKVVVYYVDADDLDALRQWERESNPTAIEVELRDLKEVLAEAVMEDHVEASVAQADGQHVVTVEAFTSDRLIQAIEAFNQKKDLPRQASLYDGTDQAEREQAFRQAGGLTLSDEGLEGIEAVFADATHADGAWTTDAEVRIDKKGLVTRDGEPTKEFWDGTISLDRQPLRLKVRSVLGDETEITLQ